MRFAFVATNLLDLWAEPRFNSERSSQLFFCELLTIHDEQQGYLLAKQADGYTGWVDKRHVVEIDESAYKAYSAGPKSVVKTPQSIILDAKRTKTPPHFLFYGTYVRAVRNSKEMVIVALPDGAKRTIKSSAITPVKSRTRDRVTGAMLVAEARRFLGVPYLWGGVSPAGFDCSGLVQTICRRFGLYVPRDTKDQLAAGTEVPRKQVKTGDLLFFKRHVGFAVDRDKIIHASVGGSGVRVNSLQPGLADYREDLDRDFNQARRLL
ncbi:hypothetical protein C3F09_01510 [candidate division GN15 bacterium]|uniref:NlpC/P60 domain-containing protein n=1 Tax=candidate division GN15 bacterium TaxID=2072418 RepID=A0A855X624_9BACT|nr:MAG: hypothetical protein C3F09_01510 [candidate division GN15 bacterium]